MNRRGLLLGLAMSSAGLGALATACSLPLLRHIPRIGYMSIGPREAFADSHAAFEAKLRELGYVDGQTVDIQWRFAIEGDDAGWPVMAHEFLRMPVDVIVVNGSTPAVMIVKQMTSNVPIVAYNVNYPVETGLVSSLAKPGGNVTAIPNTIAGYGLALKQVDLLREIVPRLTQIVGLVQIDNPALVLPWEALRGAAESVGLSAVAINMRNADELEAAFEGEAVGQSQALTNFANPILLPVRARLAELAIQNGLASMSGTLAFIQAGLLLAHAASKPEEARRAAIYVNRIFKGASAGDLAVDQPTVFDVIINVTTLHRLSLALPPSIQALVTGWVE